MAGLTCERRCPCVGTGHWGRWRGELEQPEGCGSASGLVDCGVVRGSVFSLHPSGSQPAGLPTPGAQDPSGAESEGQDLGKDTFLFPSVEVTGSGKSSLAWGWCDRDTCRFSGSLRQLPLLPQASFL